LESNWEKEQRYLETHSTEAFRNLTSGRKLAIILLTIVLGTLLLPATIQEVTAQGGMRQGMHGDLPIYYSAKTFLTTVNAILLVLLLIVYVGVYRDTKAEFLLGLIIFDVAMLLYAITSNPLFSRGFGFMGAGLGPFAMLPDLFSLVAVLVLLWQAFRYR
jgi:hypothetical protein